MARSTLDSLEHIIDEPGPLEVELRDVQGLHRSGRLMVKLQYEPDEGGSDDDGSEEASEADEGSSDSGSTGSASEGGATETGESRSHATKGPRPSYASSGSGDTDETTDSSLHDSDTSGEAALERLLNGADAGECSGPVRSIVVHYCAATALLLTFLHLCSTCCALVRIRSQLCARDVALWRQWRAG